MLKCIGLIKLCIFIKCLKIKLLIGHLIFVIAKNVIKKGRYKKTGFTMVLQEEIVMYIYYYNTLLAAGNQQLTT